MSSINTNLSAMTALQALKATQTAMNKNQSQISTGLRVGEASHNASYWSISTKMKSDNGALGAVKDSIKQSKAMINTFTSALDKTLTYLNKMKEGLVAATQPGADLEKIQTEFKANIEGLKSAATSATFNEQNWLNADTADESAATLSKLVISYDGESKAVKTLDINVRDVRLFDSTVAANGLLNDVEAIDISDPATPAKAEWDTSNLGTVVATDVLKIDFGGSVQTFAIDAAAAASPEALANAINEDASLGELVEATVEDGFLRLTSKIADQDISSAGIFQADGTTSRVAADNVDPYDPGTGTTVADALKDVDIAINKITAGSAMLGANKALLETQEEFIGVLSDSLTAGVSAFIDADMNEASTRNQALQTQQQLGVQALSMANQNSQMILKLFQ